MPKVIKNAKTAKHVKTTKSIKKVHIADEQNNTNINDGQLEDSNNESINELDNDIEDPENNDNEDDNEDDDINGKDNEYEYDGEDGEDEYDEDADDGDTKKYIDKKCIYNFTGDNEEENDIVDDLVFDDDIIEEINDIVPMNERRTKPVLFKYERCRLIGDRTQQITLGAKPMIKNTEGLHPKQIAELELENNVLPLIIQRPLPNGTKERWYIHELKR